MKRIDNIKPLFKHSYIRIAFDYARSRCPIGDNCHPWGCFRAHYDLSYTIEDLNYMYEED